MPHLSCYYNNSGTDIVLSLKTKINPPRVYCLFRCTDVFSLRKQCFLLFSNGLGSLPCECSCDSTSSHTEDFSSRGVEIAKNQQHVELRLVEPVEYCMMCDFKLHKPQLSAAQAAHKNPLNQLL